MGCITVGMAAFLAVVVATVCSYVWEWSWWPTAVIAFVILLGPALMTAGIVVTGDD